MQRIVCSITLLVVMSFFGNHVRTIAYDFQLIDSESTFGLEDQSGRAAYEQLMLANPTTGQIPVGIRTAELRFSRALDKQNSNARTEALTVTPAGPFNVGGRTRAAALDIRDENIIIAGGVSGGIWKSTDGGTTWSEKSDPEVRSSVTSLVQDTRPGREDTWYYGTGEIIGNSARGGGAPFRGNGIFKSTDNGETWNPLASTQNTDPAVFNSQFQYIWGIEVNDKNLVDDEVIVAAFGGILRSLDGGDSWTAVVGQSLFDLGPDANLNEIDASFFTGLEKTSDGVFFATLSTSTPTDNLSPEAGIYASEDGSNWHEFSPFTPGSQYRRIVMGHAPSNPGRCFFLVDSNPTFLLRFDLTGFNGNVPMGTWENLVDNVPAFGGLLGDYDSQNSFNMMVKVHPTDQDLVFIGGTNLYRSTDGFTSNNNTSWIGGYDPEGSTNVYENHHPDQHNLLFSPTDPSKLISACDGGLFLTRHANQDSVIWESLNNGYRTTQFYTVALSKDDDNFILGGMQDNGTDISSDGSLWTGILGGDGGYVATTPDKELWFASFQNGQTFRLTLSSNFTLTSFARIDPKGLVENEESGFLFINPFVIDPSSPNRMFMAGGNYLYVNDNVSQIPGGSQVPTAVGWVQVEGSFVGEGVISAVEISPDGSTAYFGTSNGAVFKIDDANAYSIQANEITSNLFPESAYVSSVAVNPENPDHFMVIFSNYEIQSIFESTDGGATFEDVSGNLEENTDGSGNGPSIRWGEIVPTNSGTLRLVGTSTGLYSTEITNGTSTIWTQESVDVVGSSIITMMDYRSTDGRLAIATHGDGMFSTTIDDFKELTIERETEAFSLNQAFPNPFNTSTRIRYTIPQDGIVRINLYSANGDLIKNLLWAPQFAGENTVTWDGTNTSGVTVSNGVYFYRVEYANIVQSGKLVLKQ